MRQHHEGRAVQPRLRKAEDSKHHEAQMADGRIRNQLLHVGLNQRHQRPVNNADQRQNHDPPRVGSGLFRKQPQVEAQHAVRSHLQQNASQQHRPGGGRFHVRVGEPCVKREERNFNRKSDKESQEQPLRCARKVRHLSGTDRVLNRHKIERPDFRIQPKDRRQHENRRDHRVHEEFDGSVNLAPVAVHSDQQRHRN